MSTKVTNMMKMTKDEDDEDDKQLSIMSMAVPKMNMNLIKKIMTMVNMKIPGKEAGPRM